MNKNDHIALWLIIIEFYSRIVSDETVGMYSRQTQSTGISYDDLEKAFDIWALNPEKCSRFPLPGDLVAIVRGTGSSRSAADQIANDALTALNCYSTAYGFSNPIGKKFTSFNQYIEETFGQPIVELITRWGGPHSLSLELNSTSAVSTVRAQLRDLAQSLIDAPHASQQISPTIALQESQSGKTELSGSQKVTSLVKKVVKNTSL